ncbi:transcription factor S [Candidatus Pacearchaeota archaeon]|nr:transcription factor S [Candidatus Pacearchaeota archaeon]
MEFCPKCGSVILGKNCVRCNYKSEKEVKLGSSQKIEAMKEIVIVSEGDGETRPTVTILCVKCKHPEAYFWTKQTRSADEAETKFYKCKKCDHTWREYR